MTIGHRRPGVLGCALLIALAAGVSARAQTSSTTAQPDAAAIGSTLSEKLLRNLPASDNVFSLFETVEGETTSDRFYGGGLNTGRAARDGAFLHSWEQTQFFVGDVNVTMPNGGTPFLFPPVNFWRQVDVATGFAPFGLDASGFAVALDPQRPAATWTRMIEVSGAGPGFVAKSSASGAPPIETLRQFSHGGLFVSGPVSPRLGLVAGADWQGSRQFERNSVSQADGQAASGFAHLVFTPNASDELRTLGWVQRTQAPFFGATAFGRPQAADQTTFTHIESTWERRSPSGLDWRVFGAYSQASSSRADAAPASPVVERLLDGPVPLFAESGDRTDRQWSFGTRAFAAPHAVGRATHVLFAGANVGRASARIAPGFSGTIAEVVDGQRARMWQYSNAGINSGRQATSITAFVSDRMSVAPGRSLEAGVEYDGVTGSADGAAQGITWNNVLPRVALRWKQGADSHFTWIAGYRRLADRLTLDTLSAGDPAAPVATVSRWTAQGVGPIVARVGPGTGGNPAFSAIDPSLARPTTDEVVAGVEAQLTPSIRGRITGISRRMHHLFNLTDVGAPTSSYTQFTIVDPRPESDGGDVLLPVYNRLPASFGADRYVLTTDTGGNDTATFEGLVLNAEASLKKLTLMVNATASQTDGPARSRGFHADENNIGALGELAVDPNAASFPRGRLFFDRAFTLKLSGVYQFPHDITLGAIARYQDGQPFSRVTVVPDLNQGTEFVRAYAAGDARFMYTGTLDVRLQKSLRIGASGVDIFVDAYNLPNMANEVEERVVTGSPAFRDITAVQPPLAVRVGLRLHF